MKTERRGHQRTSYKYSEDTGAQLWQRSLGTPVPSSVIQTTNILNEVGIISTPVIDPGTNTLYVVAKTYENSVQIFRLHALDILNQGAEKLGGPIQIAAQYPGSAVPNNTQWVHADLSKLAGAPASAGDPFACISGAQDVVYRGTDGEIHLLFLH